MVTIAAAATTMGADLVEVYTAPADKTNGNENSFAQSFGEQAGLLIGDGLQSKSAWQSSAPPPKTPEDPTVQGESKAKTSAVFVPTPANGETAACGQNAVATSNVVLKPGLQAPLPSAPQLPHGLPNKSSDAEDLSNATPTMQEAQDDPGIAVERVKPPALEPDGKNVNVPAVPDVVLHAIDHATPEPGSEVAMGRKAAGFLACEQVTTTQQGAVKGTKPVDATDQTEEQIGMTKKASVKTGEDKQEVSSEAAGQLPNGQVGSVAVVAAQSALTPTHAAASTPASVAVPVTVFATTGRVVNKEPGSGKDGRSSSINLQSVTVKQAADASKNRQQDSHSNKVDASAPEVAAPPLLSGVKAEGSTPKEATHVTSAGDDASTKLKGVSTAVPAKPNVGLRSVLGGTMSATAPLHGAVTNILATPQGGSASALIASPRPVAAEAGGTGPTTLHTMDGAHRTLEASPTTLEIGVPNGTDGWLKIRAEMTSGGGVNASLSAASPAGQEMLHRELPSLTAYLQQEQVAVNTVVVHPSAPAIALRNQFGGMGGNVDQQAQHRPGQGSDGRERANGVVTNDRTLQTASIGAVEEQLMQASQFGGMSWLSVRV